MSDKQSTFKYGEITFREMRVFGEVVIHFTVVPEAYLVQEVYQPQKIYMFRTYKEMEEYFTKKGYQYERRT
jgi:hypothetical protein